MVATFFLRTTAKPALQGVPAGRTKEKINA